MKLQDETSRFWALFLKPWNMEEKERALGWKINNKSFAIMSIYWKMGSKYPWKKTFRALAKKAENNDDWEIKWQKALKRLKEWKLEGIQTKKSEYL